MMKTKMYMHQNDNNSLFAISKYSTSIKKITQKNYNQTKSSCLPWGVMHKPCNIYSFFDSPLRPNYFRSKVDLSHLLVNLPSPNCLLGLCMIPWTKILNIQHVLYLYNIVLTQNVVPT